MPRDLNDSLDNLFTGDVAPAGERPMAPHTPAGFESKSEKLFREGCAKCRGTGQTRWGVCFRCKGAGGKVFKTAPEARAKARQSDMARKASREQDNLEAFAAQHPERHAWLIAAASRDFRVAEDMIRKIRQYGELFESSLAAIDRFMAADEARKVERTARVSNAAAVDVSRIEAAFATAKAKAARPGQAGVMVKPLRLSANGIAIRIRPGSDGSEWAGMLFVKTEDGLKLGHIKGGRFVRRRECSDEQAAAVIAAASDPESAVLAYAKAYRSCGICGRGLLNDVSIARGIGPVCAEKFGFSFVCEETE